MFSALLLILLTGYAAAQPAQHYFPGKWDDWERRTPEQSGFDAALLEKAVQFAKEHESRQSVLPLREPYNVIIGPTKSPSGMNGLILRRGYIVAEWGDTREVDMTFSVTKSYLSTTAGLAWDQGLIRDLDDPVRLYVQDDRFDTEHNSPITWHQMLNQTSGWEGNLFGKPDWADRFRDSRRPSEEPGKHWRYNDVRVNALALALLNVWRRPLPQVLKQYIMDPIDASPTWRWHGYNNSWVLIDGLNIQSVSGGGHWGGGMFINSRDQARFGYLFLRRGKWKGRQLISEKWIERASTPTPLSPNYGYMNWFLNSPQRKQFPSAPEGNIFFLGGGTNMIWIDPDHDMVVVVRWIERSQVDAFIGQLLAAISE